MDPALSIPPTPEPCRRLIRLPRPLWIGVVTVLLIVVALGLRIGIPIYRQQVAIREIQRLGGVVQFRARGPIWLRERIPARFNELFGEVDFVSLSETSATDATLAHLQGLDGLKQIWLTATSVTDSGMPHLKGLTNLQILFLDRTRVTDAGLAHLKGLTRLRILALLQTPVSDAGVAELKRELPNLTVHK
jgi:hypothetical protein